MSVSQHQTEHTETRQKRLASFWKRLGPGFITGASDDDPSGVATYSQAGAQFGTQIGWALLFTWPLMSAIQDTCARIGRVTGRGLAANMRKFYGPGWVLPMVLLLLIANIINLGADIGAMGEAASMIFSKGAPRSYALGFTVVTVLLQVFIPYHRYANVLRWLSLTLISYVGVVFFVRLDPLAILHDIFIPNFELSSSYVTTFIALLGTTISPYLFFWQASQEVEEVHTVREKHTLRRHPGEGASALHEIRLDTVIGMAISNVIALFIVIATAATLHVKGITNIQTAGEAAEALRPIAGEFSAALFAFGIIGTGLLAVPVLAGSAAYAVGEALQFRVGLEEKPAHAKRFYAVLVLATLLGVAMIYVRLNPIQALFWAAVINGLLSVPIMIFIMIMASSRKVMGQFVGRGVWKWLGWIATAVMAASTVAFFATL